MAHEWLIREIEALRDYASLNGLNALSEHLDQARLLAMTEVASHGAKRAEVTMAGRPER